VYKTVESKNLSIGIYSRISHNLVMYRITGKDDYYDKFLCECAAVLVTYDLPNEVRKDILSKAMDAYEEELSYVNSGGSVQSYGGSSVTVDALIGYHCELLADVLKKEAEMIDVHV
jgi:hypothetical protein